MCKKSKQTYFLYLIVITVFFSPLSLICAAPIQADRPGFSTGTYTVAPGMSHIEFGMQSDYNNPGGDADNYTMPLLNYRLGLTSKTELNLLWDGWNLVDDNTQTNTINDLFIGFKHRLIQNEQYNISILGYTSIPYSGNGSDSTSLKPFIALLWDYSLSDQVTAFGTLQAISFVEDEKRSNNFQPAIGLSFTHTEALSTYIEYYSDISINTRAPTSQVFDLGIAYLLTSEIQLDFNAGFALDQYSSDYVGAGLAYRF